MLFFKIKFCQKTGFHTLSNIIIFVLLIILFIKIKYFNSNAKFKFYKNTLLKIMLK